MDKLIISRYNENVDWIKEYDFDYVVYNKGSELGISINHVNKDNVGENQKDIFSYIVENYNILPNSIGFIQAYPFDHCKKETFDLLIKNNTLTRLEDYKHLIPCANVDSQGYYFERNDNWYIAAHNNHMNQTCQFNSFDSYMQSLFVDYSHLDIIPFSPGSQIIVEKERILNYPIKFWKHLDSILNRRSMTEGHIIERSLYLIFLNIYKAREEFYEL